MICTSCLLDKPEDDFYFGSYRRQDGSRKRVKTCKQCAGEARLLYYHTKEDKVKKATNSKKYREANKDKIKLHNKEMRDERKLKIVELCGNKCADCQQSFPTYVYDFHHLNPNEKDSNLATIMSHRWDTLAVELSKCIMLCSNCHRIRHHANT